MLWRGKVGMCLGLCVQGALLRVLSLDATNNGQNLNSRKNTTEKHSANNGRNSL